MPATFTQRFQVRFDECAPDGTVRAAALLRYVIETAFGHSAAEGFPLAWYDAHGLYWLVRRARLDLHHPIAYGALLDVTTEVVGFRRIWARRHNAIRDDADALLSEVAMDWIFTDKQGNPARVLREMEAAFPGLIARLEPERLDLGDPPVEVAPDAYLVLAHQVDPRGHMSSAAYPDLFEDALAGQGVDLQGRPVRYDLEYLRAALPGERLHRFVWADPRGWAMVAATPEGLPVVRGRRQRKIVDDTPPER